LNDGRLAADEKTVKRLTDEATILVIAASETPTKVLSLIMFHVLDNPAMLRRAREELLSVDALDGTATPLSQLSQLPYLSAIVTEGLRLHGGIIARSARVSHLETLHYGGFDIPPGTRMSTSSYFIHQNSAIFPRPSHFEPKRWLAGTESENLERYLVAFGRGTRNCVGRNLGTAELYITLAAILPRFEMEIWKTDIRDVLMERDWYVMQPRRDSLGVRVMVSKGKEAPRAPLLVSC
jgi:cytochrome P450